MEYYPAQGVYTGILGCLTFITFSYIIRAPGAVAQLEERVPRTDEAVGSNPICSKYIKDYIDVTRESGDFVPLSLYSRANPRRHLES